MLRHIIEWFKDVAAMWITIGIVSVLLLVFAAARQFGFTASTKIALSNQEFNDLSYEKYNGINLTGAEVMNAIKRYQEELPITVYTGESVDTYHGEFVPATNNRSSEKYIKPSQIYIGSILKNEDQEIVSLIFAKEGVLLTETSYKELLASLAGTSAGDHTMEEIISQITGQYTDKNNAIQVLTQKVSELITNIHNLESQNNSLNAQVSALSTLNNTLSSKYATLNTDVTNGKTKIAAAITGKGVTTSSTASFQTMAQNISKIASYPELKYEQFVLDNASGIGGSGYSFNFTLTTSGITPVYVVINSYMYCSTTYGPSNIDYLTVTTTKFSEGYYTCEGNYYTGNSGSNYIKISGNQIIARATFCIMYTGNYYPYQPGTTTVTVYGI